MSLSNLNKSYWKQVPEGTTTTADIFPNNTLLKFIPNTATALDVGTGTGTLADWLAKHFQHVFAIDINSNEITRNKKRQGSIHYLNEDITKKTSFSDHYFNLLCFKFTLINIHKDEWKKLKVEVLRILKRDGYIWIAEPLVSTAYKERYALAQKVLGEKNTVFVFKNPDMAKSITSPAMLHQAIKENNIARITYHFEEHELHHFFSDFALEYHHIVNLSSPSGYALPTFVGLWRRL